MSTNNNELKETLDYSKEIVYAEYLVKSIKDEKLKKRVHNVLLWYIHKANTSRILYYVLTISSILANTTIPIITLFFPIDSKDIIIAIISALSTLSISICTLLLLKDKWLRYRSYAEILKSECFKYTMSDCNDDAVKDFIGRLEKLCAAEKREWMKAEKVTQGAQTKESMDTSD